MGFPAGRLAGCLSTAEPIDVRGGLLIVWTREGRFGRLGGGVGRVDAVEVGAAETALEVEEDLDGGTGGGARLPKVVVCADFCWFSALMRSLRDVN
jgi:hypothetical protein